MPSIKVAMERSLRERSIVEGFANLFAASLRPLLGRRDFSSVTSQITDVKKAFSSWDNCMKASYCKWPVIALIIITGLIIFSVLWCFIRCACCGLSCCCECFYCLKCCGDCCGCCTPREKRNKYLDEPFVPPNQGYKAPEPMDPRAAYAAPTVPSFSAAPAAARSVPADPPQYAEFDVGKKADPDALPAMPSWENAEHKKVYLEEEVEMDTLKKPTASGSNAPLMSGVSPGPASPSPSMGNPSPYGPLNGNATSSGYFSPGASQANLPASNGFYTSGTPGSDPYGQGAQEYGQQAGAYGASSSSMEIDQGYGAGGYGVGRAPGMAGGLAAASMGQGRQSPRAYNDGGYGRGQGFAPPARTGTAPPARTGTPGQGYAPPVRSNTLGQTGYGAPPRSNTPGQGFGVPPRTNTPARQGAYDNYGRSGQDSYDNYGQQQWADARHSPRDFQNGGFPQDRMTRSPAPQAGYGYSGDNAYNNSSNSHPYASGAERHYSTDSTRPLVQHPPPSRQYSRDVPAEQTPPVMQTNGGFDFNSGHSLPSMENTNEYGSRPSASSPEPQPQASAAYPGYKPYQPPSQW